MASNLDYAEDIEEAKAYMAKKNVFQLFEFTPIDYDFEIFISYPEIVRKHGKKIVSDHVQVTAFLGYDVDNYARQLKDYSLLTAVVHNRPDNPVEFLQECLEVAKQNEDLRWNSFLHVQDRTKKSSQTTQTGQFDKVFDTELEATLNS